eukprot:gene22107-biopygen8719
MYCALPIPLYIGWISGRRFRRGPGPLAPPGWAAPPAVRTQPLPHLPPRRGSHPRRRAPRAARLPAGAPRGRHIRRAGAGPGAAAAAGVSRWPAAAAAPGGAPGAPGGVVFWTEGGKKLASRRPRQMRGMTRRHRETYKNCAKGAGEVKNTRAGRRPCLAQEPGPIVPSHPPSLGTVKVRAALCTFYRFCFVWFGDTGLVCFGLVWFGLIRSGLVRLDATSLGSVGL